jgi:putative transposase
MARPLRIEYEGAFYHVTSRGNEQKKIFYSKSDYEKFKHYLKEAQYKYGYLIHCFVLMTNHYHLLIETPKPNLSRVMHYLNSSYTNYINIKRKRSGHLFQGRYKAILIDRDNYLLELSRYVHLNPIRAEMAEKPEDYPYSSYNNYITREKEDMVYRDLIL